MIMIMITSDPVSATTGIRRLTAGKSSLCRTSHQGRSQLGRPSLGCRSEYQGMLGELIGTPRDVARVRGLAASVGVWPVAYLGFQ